MWLTGIGLLNSTPFSVAFSPWTAVHAIEDHRLHDRGLALTSRLASGERVSYRIDFLKDNLVRVRAAGTDHFEPSLPERDDFLRSNWPPVSFNVEEEEQVLTLKTPAISVRLSKDPMGLAFYTGERLLTREPDKGGVEWQKDGVRLTFLAPPDEYFMGFGDEGAGWAPEYPPDRAPFDHRSEFLMMAGLSSQRHYYVPFFMSSRGYGFFLNTLVISKWDLARSQPDRYQIEIEEPRLDYYIVAGPSFKQILRTYTELVGRPPMPPKWELGGRAKAKEYGIEIGGNIPEEGWNVQWVDQKEIESTARSMRDRREPCDYFYLGAEWQTIRNSFDWVSEVPDPAGMLDLLNRLHFKVGLWQRPLLVRGDYRLYREAEKGGYLVAGPDGRPFICEQKYGGPTPPAPVSSSRTRKRMSCVSIME